MHKPKEKENESYIFFFFIFSFNGAQSRRRLAIKRCELKINFKTWKERKVRREQKQN